MNASLKNLRDEELLFLFCTKKNTEALSIVYQRYSHLVYGVCMKYLKQQDDAKDATMQLFEKLIGTVCKYDIQLFKAWIYRVAKNHCLMILRQQNFDTKLVGEFEDSDMEFQSDLHLVEDKEELLTKMEMALSELSPEQKQCIELFYLQKKTYTEIMNITQFSFMQVKSFIQNGKRNLKLKMNQNMTNE